MYKKHYPPTLKDEVWRLEKIGKDGSFHKRLNKSGISTVEDFLRLVVRDPQKLRSVSSRVGVLLTCYYYTFILCVLASDYKCYSVIDTWKWYVQQNVGNPCGTCKDLCLKWKILHILF